jgi:hypothetical protein
VRTDPTDTGGLFVSRRPGTRPIKYRELPTRGSAGRQLFDRAISLAIAGLMVLINLLFWGPLPAGWLWIGAQVDYHTDSVSAGIGVAFVGMLLTLVAALALLKRLDHVWILVRRAAGYDQRKGILVPIFATTAAIGAVLFTFWLVFIGGLGSSIMPRNGG